MVLYTPVMYLYYTENVNLVGISQMMLVVFLKLLNGFWVVVSEVVVVMEGLCG